ncbi:hypothetical protein [Streptantibioticus ferralitis]|uniref:Gram-positive cocci surface proteins LPxTG domain-containing protein n=1 Tax=Streptantibioticus ferralitis TaxID=236510 RepID=A0ABT5YYB3_9ACTN|nr:hypothetical protein [Streptantibioticus ferralitis]MDF2255795.1 hypothetical protein [Streptantibioticus ferralitis]
MSSGRTAAVALTAVAAVGLTAPAALASVSPNPASPGQTVHMSDDRKCEMSKGATASSPLFGEVALSAGADRMVAGLTTPPTAKPGRYPVTIRCGYGGLTISSTMTVRAPQPDAAQPAASARAGTGPKPTKGVRAGSGGGVGGWDAPQVAGGAALLALAASGALVLVRRRRGSGSS